jgi:hypothetical protein
VKQPPPYFERIRVGAAGRWRQLEEDPELAGPWHQLFKQVQSPRHVLSELLQNADDAGATSASVAIEQDRFVFTHNGEDFKEDHFASLCRFGYSNKRALHTIGFRGIGFKSTFSLGEPVQLRTPSLSVGFYRTRFTEPHWLGTEDAADGVTEISVHIEDSLRLRELQTNLREWLASPVSLLFFKNIRRLRIGGEVVEWQSLGPGPTHGTEWMALTDNSDTAFLVAASEEEEFPDDALAEIRNERMLGADQVADFPPSRVEIVLGAPGRLYVVLPTGVQTTLPFACNAPFIQDPARLKIKDPETSPTNRWLLERAGKLAASVLLEWVRDKSASQKERAQAYGLVPEPHPADGTLERSCAALVEDALGASLSGEHFLLTESGALAARGGCVAIPNALLEVWSAEELASHLDPQARPTLSAQVTGDRRSRLVQRGYVASVGRPEVIERLTSRRLPRPKGWTELLRLWAYLGPGLTGWQNSKLRPGIRISPAQGKDELYSSSELVRLGDKRLLQSDEDWEFLSPHLLVLNPNWPRWILDQQREAAERSDDDLLRATFAAHQLIQELGLAQAADLGRVLEQVAARFFRGGSISIAGCVRLSQIAAKLDAPVGASFRFVTRDRQLRAPSYQTFYDADGTLEELLPEEERDAHLLHPEYTRAFSSCSAEEWQAWVASGRSGLLEAVTPVETKLQLWGKDAVLAELKRRGFNGEITYSFKSNSFRIDDWDFAPRTWEHWTGLSMSDGHLWARIVARVMSQPTSWTNGRLARAQHVSNQSTTRLLTSEPLPSRWVLRLRETRCLPDVRGQLHRPADLLRRTPATEALLDVEPFVHGRLDTEANRPLLDMLGVRATPTGPDRLVDCLRALSASSSPPETEVDKWYRRLDQLLDSCSTAEFSDVQRAFRNESLVRTEAGDWVSLGGVFISADEEDAPGAPVVRASVRHLTIWRKLGVADRPTADLAVAWLKGLPSGAMLAGSDAKRVRTLLGRHALRIWAECQHWLSLNSRWSPIAELEYAVSMRSLVGRQHLHEWVRQRTADLQSLSAELTGSPPFSELPTLASVLEERFQQPVDGATRSEPVPWLNSVGAALRRISLDDQITVERLRNLGQAFERTRLRTVPNLEIVHYVDGVPAGTPQRAEVVWIHDELLVAPLPTARLARLIPSRLAGDDPDVAAALSYCFGRTTDEVLEYLEQNFSLSPLEVVCPPAPQTRRPSEESTELVGPAAEPPSAIDTHDDTELDLVRMDPGTISGDDTDESTGLEVDPDPADASPGKPRPPVKPAQPGLMQRFAAARGFVSESPNRFVHSDGSWIERVAGDLFPWERWSAGAVVRRYWVKDHCLDQEPLAVPAEVWSFLERNPATAAMLLLDPSGAPIELLGDRLRRMRDEGELSLFPASYRLVRAP